ncbi:MAG: hypothetical protein K6E11_03590 [Bacilli bacterium]|nr:hypothetical protein [Bacilli bacterium]
MPSYIKCPQCGEPLSYPFKSCPVCGYLLESDEHTFDDDLTDEEYIEEVLEDY